MKIAVLVKQVPDTFGERRLDPETGLLDRDASDLVIDEINERALELALQHKDFDKSVEVIAVAMGPGSTQEALRKALATGADRAVHILDDALGGADAWATARALGSALRREAVDLIVGGNESTDGRGGVVPSMIAEILGMPALTSVAEVTLTSESVSGVRSTEYGEVAVSAPLPAVVTVTERAPEARFPNFKGIMTAKKKPLAVVTLAELEPTVPADAPRSVVVSVAERPAREAGTKVVDDGTAGAQVAEFLVSNRLV